MELGESSNQVILASSSAISGLQKVFAKVRLLPLPKPVFSLMSMCIVVQGHWVSHAQPGSGRRFVTPQPIKVIFPKSVFSLTSTCTMM